MTKTDGEAIAVLQNQMENFTDTLAEVSADVKTIKTSLEEKYALKSELRTFKYVTVPLVIFLSAVITGLVYYYLSHSKNLTNPDVQNNTVNSAPASSGNSGSNLPVSSTPSTPSTSTTNNNTTSPPPSSSGGGLLNVPKVQGVN